MKGHHRISIMSRIKIVCIILLILILIIYNINSIIRFIVQLNGIYILLGAIFIASIIFIIIGIKQIINRDKTSGVFTLLCVVVYGFLGPVVFLSYENVDIIDIWVKTRPAIDIILKILLIIALLSPTVLLIVSEYIYDKSKKVLRVLIPFLIVCIIAGTGIFDFSDSWIMVSYFAVMLIPQIIILVSDDENYAYRYIPVKSQKIKPYKKDSYEYDSTSSESNVSGNLSSKANDFREVKTGCSSKYSSTTSDYTTSGVSSKHDAPLFLSNGAMQTHFRDKSGGSVYTYANDYYNEAGEKINLWDIDSSSYSNQSGGDYSE